MSRKPRTESTRPVHSSLAVVLQVREGRLQTLLWQRAREPFARPGRSPAACSPQARRSSESIRRHLAAKVDVREVAHLEQLGTLSDPARNPEAWELATAYLGLVPLGVDPDVPADTSWHPVGAPPADRLRPRRGRARRARAAAREALLHEHRLRAGAGVVHARRATRRLCRRARDTTSRRPT